MSTSINETITLKGHVSITEVSDSGSRVLVDEQNLIVLSGRNALLNSIAGVVQIGVSDVHFGSSGTVTGNSNTPITPLPSDTDAYGVIAGLLEGDGKDYIFTKTVTEGHDTVSPRILFSITVPKGSTNLNNKNINSLALMMDNALAFSVKNFGTISKSSDISLIILWSIYC